MAKTTMTYNGEGRIGAQSFDSDFVEFGLFITGENGKGPSFVTTSHEKNSEGKRPSIFIHKSLIPVIGKLTDKRLTVIVPRNIPSFVRHIDFPKSIFEIH